MGLKEEIIKRTSVLDEIFIEVERAKSLHPGEFNSTHEGYAVLLEEVRELENEIFFGKKKTEIEFLSSVTEANALDLNFIKNETNKIHKQKIREEAIQVAAMCVRIITELTDK